MCRCKVWLCSTWQQSEGIRGLAGKVPTNHRETFDTEGSELAGVLLRSEPESNKVVNLGNPRIDASEINLEV